MKTGVLLAQLGTPDSPSVKDVRKYLREFLTDKYVIDIPWLKRWLLVNLIIAPFRAPKSAKLYKEIWTDEGSPLLIHTKKSKELLQEKLGDSYHVAMGMRYQSPSIKNALIELKDAGVSQVIAIPLYPQYASATSKSTIENIKELSKLIDGFPKITFIEKFYDNTLFKQSWEEIAKKHNPENYDHVIFSFHGLPERQIKKLDQSKNHCLKVKNCCSMPCEWNEYCYKHHCYETAKNIAKNMNLSEQDYTVCFQSRLGKDPWIQPCSDHVIEEKGKEGCKNLLVFSPAFVADCLETLYEITIEYGELFVEHGGEKVQLVESLNSSPKWIATLKGLVEEYETK